MWHGFVCVFVSVLCGVWGLLVWLLVSGFRGFRCLGCLVRRLVTCGWFMILVGWMFGVFVVWAPCACRFLWGWYNTELAGFDSVSVDLMFVGWACYLRVLGDLALSI